MYLLRQRVRPLGGFLRKLLKQAKVFCPCEGSAPRGHHSTSNEAADSDAGGRRATQLRGYCGGGPGGGTAGADAGTGGPEAPGVVAPEDLRDRAAWRSCW